MKFTSVIIITSSFAGISDALTFTSFSSSNVNHVLARKITYSSSLLLAQKDSSETEVDFFAAPSLAQTHMQGPLKVNGSGKPLTKEEMDAVRKELEDIKAEYGYKEPVRSFMDDPNTKWIFGGPPDYSLTNLFYLKQRTKQHTEGSLEEVVENLVKTWEMERSHKADPTQHLSVDQEKFRLSANGGKKFDNIEANAVGNYNVLLNACPAELWDSSITWEGSHEKFHGTFAAFPWEVLDVYSPPPTVSYVATFYLPYVRSHF